MARHHFAWSGLSPAVTAVHALADALLFRSALLHPVYAVIGAAVLLGGWIVQFFWWILSALYLAYLVLAAIAMHRWRRQRRQQVQRL
jgi:membrane protein implicated in regulation of membrane protease activity